jgi:hypothetical protein
MNTSTHTHSSGAASCCGGGTTASPSPSCGCGGTGCSACSARGFVRPRFFAGQLLTEEDLEALSTYVTAKNRLHNRHIVGEGVVCGLEVLCHPCGGGKLVVRPGHAIDCCGNDIVLECPVELDVNTLVRDLRRDQRGGYDCGDPCAKPPKPKPKPKDPKAEAAARGTEDPDAEVDEPSRRYCLYIRYDEQAIEPVAPYATDEPCGNAPCEFARVREGVRFELRCRMEPEPARGFLAQVIECVGDPTAAGTLASKIRAMAVTRTPASIAEAREALLDRLDNSPALTDCALRAQVAAIAIPAANQDELPAARSVLFAYLAVLRECACRALLPPCPPCEDPAVLLACLDIEECDVVDICNLERRFALTAPNFRHWFPVDLFGDALESACCEDLFPPPEEEKKDGTASNTSGEASGAAAGATTSPIIKKKASAATAKDQALRDEEATARFMQASLERLGASLGIRASRAPQLLDIASDLGEALDSELSADLIPLRILRRTIPTRRDLRETLSREVLASDAFKSRTVDTKRGPAPTDLEEKTATLEQEVRALGARLLKLEGGKGRRPGGGG